VALGGHARSRELRTWATRELSGYAPTDDIPEYRTVSAMLKLDGSNLRFLVEGQQISPSQLPDFARDDVKEQVTLFQGVGELEALLENARSNGGFLRVSFAGASDLAAYMNSRADYGTAVHRIYHGVSAISVAGVLDRARTTLTELVAEPRDGHTDAEGVPLPESAAQALNVVVHGRGHLVPRPPTFTLVVGQLPPPPPSPPPTPPLGKAVSGRPCASQRGC